MLILPLNSTSASFIGEKLLGKRQSFRLSLSTRIGARIARNLKNGHFPVVAGFEELIVAYSRLCCIEDGVAKKCLLSRLDRLRETLTF